MAAPDLRNSRSLPSSSIGSSEKFKIDPAIVPPALPYVLTPLATMQPLSVPKLPPNDTAKPGAIRKVPYSSRMPSNLESEGSCEELELLTVPENLT